MNTKFDVIIIGAGFSGITVAASLKKFGIDNFVILEKGETVASIWKNAYERLATHTPYFSLPFFKPKKKYSTFKTKDEIVDYLTEYAKYFQVDSQINFAEKVEYIEKNKLDTSDYKWEIKTSKNKLQCKIIVICTGFNNKPIIPQFFGQDNYGGKIIHSNYYKNGMTYQNKKVLVIGSGNSAAEIALDLYEHGATTVHMLIRGKRWVFHLYPRLRKLQYILGELRSKLKYLFIQNKTDKIMENMEKAIEFSSEELEIAIDKTEKFVKRFSVDLSAHSIYPEDKGAIYMEVNHGRVAWVDRGTIKQIRKGNIKVIHSSIKELTQTGAIFTNGESHNYDAIILGTGFSPGINTILEKSELYLNINDYLLPKTNGKCQSTIDSTLYFVGFEKTVSRASSYGKYGWCAGRKIANQLL